MMDYTTGQWREGLAKAGTMASIVAAATPITLYTLSPGRTARIIKLAIMNRNANDAVVQIGDGLGVGYVQRIPGIFVAHGMPRILEEEELQNFEFTGNITVQADQGAAAPNDIQIQATVKEYMGPTG